jgi:hypothetical protein
MPDNTGSYKTSDLYYASFLRVAGVKFIEATREEGRTFFLFENGEAIRDLKREYFNRTAKVCALDYADEVRNMKAMIHQ